MVLLRRALLHGRGRVRKLGRRRLQVVAIDRGRERHETLGPRERRVWRAEGSVVRLVRAGVRAHRLAVAPPATDRERAPARAGVRALVRRGRPRKRAGREGTAVGRVVVTAVLLFRGRGGLVRQGGHGGRRGVASRRAAVGRHGGRAVAGGHGHAVERLDLVRRDREPGAVARGHVRVVEERREAGARVRRGRRGGRVQRGKLPVVAGGAGRVRVARRRGEVHRGLAHSGRRRRGLVARGVGGVRRGLVGGRGEVVARSMLGVLARSVGGDGEGGKGGAAVALVPMGPDLAPDEGTGSGEAAGTAADGGHGGGADGGRDGEGDRAEADGAAGGYEAGHLVGTLPGLGEPGGDTTLEVGDDLGRRVAIEGGVCCGRAERRREMW